VVSRRALAASALILVAGCRPELVEPGSAIEAPTLLAVSSDPPEGEPGGAIALRAVYVGRDGAPIEGAALDAIGWARCTARKPLAELGPVAPACLDDPSVLSPLGRGASLDAQLPADACRTFGPEQPTVVPGEPTPRAYDPDPTGGYYVPFRVELPKDARDREALFEVRVRCGLAGASGAQSAEFGRRYRTNGAPTVARLARVDGAGTASTIAPATSARDAVGLALRPGERATLRAELDACPANDVCGDGVCGIDEDAAGCVDDCRDAKRCHGAERYLWFDPASRTLVTRRETLRFAWYASGGSLDLPRTGRAEGDLATFTENGFVAPTSGSGWLWIVARDDRGGATAVGYRFEVR
jgi:hypothetical protein